MATAIISAYADGETARKAVDALRKEGFDEGEIRTLGGDAKKLASELSDYGFEKDDVKSYADAADAGKTLVVASVAEDKADRAVEIMDRFESEGGEASGGERAGSVPVVEEELSVNKSKSANGGVRVTSSVKEQPVEETVRLREETVRAEKRPADRRLDDDEAEAAFKNKTVEMMGTTEEVEVQKEARVVGEVALEKETTEHEKTVQDRVRKTEVEVEEIAPKSQKKK